MTKANPLPLLLAAGLLLASSPALAQERGPSQNEENSESERSTEQPSASLPRGPNTSDYAVQLRLGINLLRAGDARGAIEELRRAVALDGSRPEGAYLLAEAQRMAGDLSAALDTFRGAARIAQQAERHRDAARALMGIAATLEQLATQPAPEGASAEGASAESPSAESRERAVSQAEAAREAWMEYARFGDAHQGVAHPQVGRARAQAITVMLEQERIYVEVRQRIAARVQELARQEQERQEQARPQ